MSERIRSNRNKTPILVIALPRMIGTQPRFTVKDAAGQPLLDRALPAVDVRHHADAMAVIHAWLHEHARGATLRAIGHRVVHGGQHFSEPVLVDTKILAELEALVPLAPLHQPHSLSVVRAVQEALPGLPQVACFDTAFHRTQPAVAQAFALPRRLTEEGVRRYGLHGLGWALKWTQPPMNATARVSRRQPQALVLRWCRRMRT